MACRCWGMRLSDRCEGKLVCAKHALRAEHAIRSCLRLCHMADITVAHTIPPDKGDAGRQKKDSRAKYYPSATPCCCKQAFNSAVVASAYTYRKRAQCGYTARIATRIYKHRANNREKQTRLLASVFKQKCLETFFFIGFLF